MALKKFHYRTDHVRALPNYFADLDARVFENVRAASTRERALTVCLDDEALRELPCDLLVNGNLWATAARYAPSPGRRVLAGPAFNLIRTDYFAAAGGPSRDRAPLRVLVTFGGEDPHNHTLWVLERLGDLLAEHEVTLVVGPAHPDPTSVRRAATARLPGARIADAPAALIPFIAASDLAITAGGTTCYELAAARVPQLAIAVEDHQKTLIEALAARGCLTIMGAHDDLETARARDLLAGLLGSAEARGRQAEAAAALFPGSGLPAIAAAILEHHAEAA